MVAQLCFSLAPTRNPFRTTFSRTSSFTCSPRVQFFPHSITPSHRPYHLPTPQCFQQIDGDDDEDEDDDYDEEQPEFYLHQGSKSLGVGVEVEVLDGNTIYRLVYAVDEPVTFAHKADNGEYVQVDQQMHAELFPLAKAVLAENNILLKDTAHVLTVDDVNAELEAEEEEEEEEEKEEQKEEQKDVNDAVDGFAEDGGSAEVEELARFNYNDHTYVVVAYNDPMYFVTKACDGAHPTLVEGDELQHATELIHSSIDYGDDG